ncbi:hypothetical protein FBUS_03123 [Fasciolopsis buskii]|uniref:Uncharacterized protein n=1 Tax=Fasciolopsis buskii TaxID=27845 RepID=A0A8E0S8H5_9TREM|nr:hypothetical protein FBUS_03123 [Fasciolopsis buski]
MSEPAECETETQTRQRATEWKNGSMHSDSDYSRDEANKDALVQSDSLANSVRSNCHKVDNLAAGCTNLNKQLRASVLRKLMWRDLIEQTRMKLVEKIDQHLDDALTNLVALGEERDKNAHSFQWDSDYMEDK